MEKHRVYTTNGWRDFGDIDAAMAFHATDGIGEIENIVIEQMPFNKREWELQIVEPAVIAYIESVIRPMPYDYINIGDVTKYLTHAQYSEEAATIMAWYWACMASITEQIEPLTEPVDVNVIINELPTLTL